MSSTNLNNSLIHIDTKVFFMVGNLKVTDVHVFLVCIIVFDELQLLLVFNGRCTLPVLWTRLCHDYRTGYTVGLAIKHNGQNLACINHRVSKSTSLKPVVI